MRQMQNTTLVSLAGSRWSGMCVLFPDDSLIHVCAQIDSVYTYSVYSYSINKIEGWGGVSTYIYIAIYASILFSQTIVFLPRLEDHSKRQEQNSLPLSLTLAG